DLTVKLTDYALSRDLFPQDYDCLPMDPPNEARPIKFMAIESITDRRYSTASDVVSFVVFQLIHHNIFFFVY
ncbi:MAG: protein kinase, partial [Ignavibacteria bacterium]|nr:protein kinase [Ignavibacteria bacterium]